jgi:hypothetical protein
MRSLLVVFTLLLWSPVTGVAAETSRLAFVSEYVRELGANENSRALGEREFAEPNAQQLPTMIRGSTRIVLELTAQVGILKRMTLSGRFVDLPANVAQFYEQKIDAHNRMIAMVSALLSGPKPGVDYGAITAEAPKITATLEYIDRALFEATPLIFATLIDEKPDKEGHVSRLTITRAQRDDLVRKLQLSFGNKMEQADQNHIVSAATVLLSKKGYKCSDEPL